MLKNKQCKCLAMDWYLYHCSLVALVPFAFLNSKKILKHEQISHDRVIFCAEAFKAQQRQLRPLFLIYRDSNLQSEIASIFSNMSHRQPLQAIKSIRVKKRLKEILTSLEKYYLADGHHRLAAIKWLVKLKQIDPTNAVFLVNFMAEHQVNISSYAKILTENIKVPANQFIDSLDQYFIVTLIDPGLDTSRHEIILYLNKNWYSLQFRNFSTDIPPQSVVEQYVFNNLLQINTDNYHFYIKSVKQLSSASQWIESSKENFYAVFFFQPLTVEDVYRVAESEILLPINSTCFEPKIPEKAVTLSLKEYFLQSDDKKIDSNTLNEIEIGLGMD